MASRWDYRLGPHDLADGGLPGLVLMPPGLRQATIAGLESRKDKNDWFADWPLAVERICALQWEIAMSDASNEISLRIDRLYRLLDSSINGTAYSSVANPAMYGGFSVTPAIPAAPPAFSPLSAIGTNALRLIISDMEFRDNERKAQLAEIITKLQSMSTTETGEALDEIIAQLTAIAAVL